MKKATLILALLALGLAGSASAQQKKRGFETLQFPEIGKIQMPAVEKAQTANGIRLRLIRNERTPLVKMQILLKGGSVFDPAGKTGLADVTAQLLRIGGARDLSPQEMDRQLEANGISIGLGASTDSLVVNLTCLKETLPKALDLLSAILAQPRFDAGKFDEVKTQMASGISRRNDDPAGIRRREFGRLAYGENSPLARELEYEDLDRITVDDVKACYAQFFAPANLLVGITGPLSMEEARPAFEKALGAWTATARGPEFPSVAEPARDFKVAFAEKSSLNQCYFAVGHLGTRYDAATEAAITVFNSIFVQSFDSRLIGRVRTKMGLTYGVGGGIGTSYLYPGLTLFASYTKSGSTFQAIKAIFDEIGIIRREKVTERELKDAKDNFLNSFVFRFETPENVLGIELTGEFYGLGEGYLNQLAENVRKVTADDVQKVANTLMTPEKMFVFIVGNGKELDGPLDQLGPVKKVDLSIKPPALQEAIAAPTPETLEKGKRIMTQALEKNYAGYRTATSCVVEEDAQRDSPMGSLKIQSKTTTVFPDKVRQELALPFGKMEMVFNGGKGVIRMQGQSQPVPAEQVEKMRFADIADIVRGADRYSFQYLATETADGRAFDVIYVTDAAKHWAKFFISQDNGRVEMQESLMEDMTGAQSVNRVVNSDFRVVENVAVPFHSETTSKGKKVGESTVKTVQFNVAVDPALFQVE